MPDTTSRCRNAVELEQFVSRVHSAHEIEELGRHLEECETCAETVDRILSRDTLTEAMRMQASGQATPLPPLGELMDRIIRLKRFGDSLPPEDTALSAVGLDMDVPAGRRQLPGPTTINLERAPLATEAGARSEPHSDEEVPWDFLAPPQAADEMGRLGPYRILKVLGHGGMGIVFQAQDPQLERLVALKAVLPALAASLSAKKRFLREARAAASIKHDHIVTIHQVGEDRGIPYRRWNSWRGSPSMPG